MRYKLMVALLLCSAALGTPALADEHGHSGDGISFWEWWSIHEDHDARCDNQDGSGIVHGPAYCWDYGSGSQSSRESVTDCEINGGQDCVARATVLCPGKTGYNGAWITFVAWCAPGSPAEAGPIGTAPDGPMKGVRCGSISCGCVVTSSSTSRYFGNLTSNFGFSFICD